MQVKVKILDNYPDKSLLPSRQSVGASGFDLLNASGPLSIFPGERILVKTGIKIELPGVDERIDTRGWGSTDRFIGEAQIRPRSGLALKHGITVLNSPGTVDADYRGEIGVILINHGNRVVLLPGGERIAQIVFNEVQIPDLEIVEELSITDRGDGGFGSTGNR